MCSARDRHRHTSRRRPRRPSSGVRLVTTAQAVVDSHIHFWDTHRFDYPWLQAFSELNRPFVPADLEVGDVQIEALVFVQANPVWDVVDQETAWSSTFADAMGESRRWWPVCHSTAAQPQSAPRSNDSVTSLGSRGYASSFRTNPKVLLCRPGSSTRSDWLPSSG